MGWRAPVASVLIVIGCLLAPVSVLGVWTANQVSDTSRYVANVEPLVHDPAIQNALTDKLTNEITSRLDVTGFADPGRLGCCPARACPGSAALLKTVRPVDRQRGGRVHPRAGSTRS